MTDYASYGDYLKAQGRSFEDREFGASDVEEALAKIESWRDDQGKKNDWARGYVSYHVMSPLFKAIKAKPELLTSPVWERVKSLVNHPEREVRGHILNPLREIAGLDARYMGDVKDIMIRLARTSEDEYERDAGIHLLYQIASDSKDPAMIEEAAQVFTDALKDPAARVRHIAQDRLEGLALYDGVDPVRVMKLLAPLLKDPDSHVRIGARANLEHMVRKTLPKIEPLKAGELRALFQAQAEGATGWRNRDLRKGVQAVTDTFDFYAELIKEASASLEGAEKLDVFSDLFFNNKTAKAIEWLAPLLQDKRPAVQSWAAYHAYDMAFNFSGRDRGDGSEAPRLRAIFQAQLDAARWWERTVVSSNKRVLEGFDFDAQNSRRRRPEPSP
jgi:hypothetical protein